jgi:hypothetical protein
MRGRVDSILPYGTMGPALGFARVFIGVLEQQVRERGRVVVANKMRAHTEEERRTAVGTST